MRRFSNRDQLFANYCCFKVTKDLFLYLFSIFFSAKQASVENGDSEKNVEKVKNPEPAPIKDQNNKEESEEDDENAPESGDKKKKKRKKNKKKGGASNENSSIGTKPGKAGLQYGQTNPPTIPIIDLFKDGKYPEGEIQKYPVDERTAKDRFTSEEKKAIDAAHSEVYNEVRLAAEAHRETRQYMVTYLLKIFHNHIS